MNSSSLSLAVGPEGMWMSSEEEGLPGPEAGGGCEVGWAALEVEVVVVVGAALVLNWSSTSSRSSKSGSESASAAVSVEGGGGAVEVDVGGGGADVVGCSGSSLVCEESAILRIVGDDDGLASY